MDLIYRTFITFLLGLVIFLLCKGLVESTQRGLCSLLCGLFPTVAIAFIYRGERHRRNIVRDVAADAPFIKVVVCVLVIRVVVVRVVVVLVLVFGRGRGVGRAGEETVSCYIYAFW